MVSRKFAIFVMLFFAVVMISMTAISAQQGPITVTGYSATCDSVTLDYTTAGQFYWVDIEVYNDVTSSNNYLATDRQFWTSGGTFTLTFPTQTNTNELRIFLGAEQDELPPYEATLTVTAKVDCGGVDSQPTKTAVPSIPSDGRFCFGPGAAPVALYSRSGGLDIYEIDGSDKGLLIMRFTAADLKALPAKPEENLVIGSSKDKKIFFYKLTSGEYQINVGPVEWTNKVHVCRFSAIPDVDAVLTSFYLK